MAISGGFDSLGGWISVVGDLELAFVWARVASLIDFLWNL